MADNINENLSVMSDGIERLTSTVQSFVSAASGINNNSGFGFQGGAGAISMVQNGNMGIGDMNVDPMLFPEGPAGLVRAGASAAVKRIFAPFNTTNSGVIFSQNQLDVSAGRIQDEVQKRSFELLVGTGMNEKEAKARSMFSASRITGHLTPEVLSAISSTGMVVGDGNKGVRDAVANRAAHQATIDMYGLAQSPLHKNETDQISKRLSELGAVKGNDTADLANLTLSAAEYRKRGGFISKDFVTLKDGGESTKLAQSLKRAESLTGMGGTQIFSLMGDVFDNVTSNILPEMDKFVDKLYMLTAQGVSTQEYSNKVNKVRSMFRAVGIDDAGFVNDMATDMLAGRQERYELAKDVGFDRYNPGVADGNFVKDTKEFMTSPSGKLLSLLGGEMIRRRGPMEEGEDIHDTLLAFAKNPIGVTDKSLRKGFASLAENGVDSNFMEDARRIQSFGTSEVQQRLNNTNFASAGYAFANDIRRESLIGSSALNGNVKGVFESLTGEVDELGDYDEKRDLIKSVMKASNDRLRGFTTPGGLNFSKSQLQDLSDTDAQGALMALINNKAHFEKVNRFFSDIKHKPMSLAEYKDRAEGVEGAGNLHRFTGAVQGFLKSDKSDKLETWLYHSGMSKVEIMGAKAQARGKFGDIFGELEKGETIDERIKELKEMANGDDEKTRELVELMDKVGIGAGLEDKGVASMTKEDIDTIVKAAGLVVDKLATVNTAESSGSSKKEWYTE